MRLRHYLRGLGLGIIVATLIVAAGKNGKAAELSDDEIRTRARALGMVEEDELLLSQAKDLADEAAGEEKSITEPEEKAVSEGTAPSKTASGQSVSGQSLSEQSVSEQEVSDTSVSGQMPSAQSLSGQVVSESRIQGETDGIFKGAGAESAFENGTISRKEELNSDAGMGSASKPTDAKKTTSSSDKKQTSSSDKKTKEPAVKEAKQEEKPAPAQETQQKPAQESAKETTQTQETPQAQESEGTTQFAAGTVTIVKGESSTAVAKKLQQAGVIPDATQFDQYLCLNGYDRKLVTGDHVIPAQATARQIAEIITSK